MKIDGLGQVNSVDKLKTTKSRTDETEFENALKKAYDQGDKKMLKKACDQFESLMLQMMYKQMKATIPEGGFIDKSNARTIFEDMLDETLMEQASTRSMGLSDMMYKQLSLKMDRTYSTQSVKDDIQANIRQGNMQEGITQQIKDDIQNDINFDKK